MESYSVRSVVLWLPQEGQKLKYLYEERITLWHAESIEEAIDLAEEEAKAYAEKEGFTVLGLFQSYWMFDEASPIKQGTEVFSLLRESDLEPNQYLDAFFDTEYEHQGDYENA